MSGNQVPNNKFYSFIILLLFFAGCNNNSGTPANVTVIEIDYRQAVDELDIGPYLEGEMEVIPLEVNDRCLIGEINNIHISENRIIVSDYRNNSVHIFDRQGGHISTLNKLGRAPNEYLDITCTEVKGDSVIVIFDKLNIRNYYYDLDCKFLRSEDMGLVWASDIVHISDKLYMINGISGRTKSGNYYIFGIDKKGNVEKYLPFPDFYLKKNVGWGLRRHYSKNGSELLFYTSPMDTLYILSGNKAWAEYYVDFGSRKLPSSFALSDGYTALREVHANDYIKGVSKVLLLDDLLFIDFTEEWPYTTIYNKNTGDVMTAEMMTVDDYPGFYYRPSCSIARDNILITWFFANEFIRNFTIKKPYSDESYPKGGFEERMVKLRDSLSPDDNPVIFINKFK